MTASASWFAEEAVAAPAPARAKPKQKPTQKAAAKPRSKTRSRARRRASRGAILWIAVGAVLLAGVVFVNLAVLRLNLALDRATQERAKLRAGNAALQSDLSAALASPRIQAEARRQDGLVPADQSTTRYVDLAP